MVMLKNDKFLDIRIKGGRTFKLSNRNFEADRFFNFQVFKSSSIYILKNFLFFKKLFFYF